MANTALIVGATAAAVVAVFLVTKTAGAEDQPDLGGREPIVINWD